MRCGRGWPQASEVGRGEIHCRQSVVAEAMRRAREMDAYHLTIDLEKCQVRDEQGFLANFKIDEFVRHCLLHGLDDIALTLQHEAEIEAYETQHPVPQSVLTLAP